MRRGRLLALVAGGLLVVSACASGASTESSTEAASAKDSASERGKAIRTRTVHLPKSYAFDPEVIEVDTGAEVTWNNDDDFPHTVRLLDGSGVDRKLGVGESTSITFERVGVFRYDCSLHPNQMKGQVIVRGSSS